MLIRAQIFVVFNRKHECYLNNQKEQLIYLKIQIFVLLNLLFQSISQSRKQQMLQL